MAHAIIAPENSRASPTAAAGVTATTTNTTTTLPNTTTTPSLPQATGDETPQQSYSTAELNPRLRRHGLRKSQIARVEDVARHVPQSQSSSQSLDNSSYPTPDRSETVDRPMRTRHGGNYQNRRSNPRPAIPKLVSPSPSTSPPPPIIYDTIEVMLEPPPDYISNKPPTRHKRKGFKHGNRRSKRRKLGTHEEQTQMGVEDLVSTDKNVNIDKVLEGSIEEDVKMEDEGENSSRAASLEVAEVEDTSEPIADRIASLTNYDDEEPPSNQQPEPMAVALEEKEDQLSADVEEPPLPGSLDIPADFRESLPEYVPIVHEPTIPLSISALNESVPESFSLRDPAPYPQLRTLQHVSIPATPEPDEFHDDERFAPLSAAQSQHSEDINDWLMTDAEQSMEEEAQGPAKEEPNPETLDTDPNGDKREDKQGTEPQTDLLLPSVDFGRQSPSSTLHPREENEEVIDLVSAHREPSFEFEEPNVESEQPTAEGKDLSNWPEHMPLEPAVAALGTQIHNETRSDSEVESQSGAFPRSHIHVDPVAMLIDEARNRGALESPSPPLRTVLPRRIAPRPILPTSVVETANSNSIHSDMAHSAMTTRDSSRDPMDESNQSSVPMHEASDSARSSPFPVHKPALSASKLRRSTRRGFETTGDLHRRLQISLDITPINASTAGSSVWSPVSLDSPPVASPSPPSRAVSPSFGLRTTPRPLVRPPTRPARGGLRHINHDNDPRSKLLMARPKTAIPPHISSSEYARECLDAAIYCRLPPYNLDPAEHRLFRTHINHVQVTTYLNIRNGILRMWMLNPTIAVCREEALGVAKEERHLEMAAKCHEFLVRHGYINFGCILPSRPLSRPEDVFPTKPSKKRKRVVVIGAGAAGLGCARQLEGLFIQFADRFSRNEDLPEVVLLEGRDRVGGRIYSHPLTPPTVLERPASSSLSKAKSSTLSSVSSVSRISSSSSLQDSLQRVPDPAVDLGAQIVTGFENGNPLSPIIKRQLRLRWHRLHDDSLLFNDQDGARVDTTEDKRAEKLFNDILDRASAFKEKVKDNYLIEGDRELMDQGREPHGESGRQIAKVEENEAALPPMPPSPPLSPKVESTNSGHPSLAGKKLWIPAQRSLAKMGFKLKDSDGTMRKARLDQISANTTLGVTTKTILGDILELVDLNPMDMKLLNWHWANLEYGNATNLNNLSLKYWDQDDGNEFLGAHAMILGGYGQFTTGLASFPTKLNIRYNQRVRKIRYGKSQDATLVDVDEPPVAVVCDDGSLIRADAVVVTSSLGVLKSSMMQFDPELPAEKTAAISRLGFGLLNKVVLVYDMPFWDIDADFIGCLRTPETGDLRVQDTYEAVRGRFYLIWNCTASCGRPTLVALMAGDAALQVEEESDGKLVSEMTSILARIHHKQTLPPPTQYIVTRWNSDVYARGSYSFVGAESSGKDYDILGQSVDRKVFFAGEATCRTHPATVHGAYLSGLRAASEVLETFIGKIDLPSGDVLIPKKNHPFRNPLVEESRIPRIPQRTDPESSRYKARNVRRDRFSKIAEECSDRILAQIGPKPIAPKKYLANAFLLFQKDRWEEARKKANQAKSLATSETPDLASRDEIRASMGRMWKNLPEEAKKRYNDAIEKEKTQYREEMSTFDARVEAWESGAEKMKEEMKAKLEEIELTEEEKMLVRAAEEEEKLEILAREERAKLRKFYEDVGIDDILPDDEDEVSEDLYLESDDAVLDHLLRRLV